MKNFKSGQYINQGYYKSFQPNFINKEWHILDMNIISLLSKADRELGRLDMYSEYVNIELFIKMHIIKEATQSSRIEGTQTNIEEVLLDKIDVNVDRRNDWEEVQNYISAMNLAIELLNELPFSSRLIKKVHKVLLTNVRGKYKMPGEYRTSQNWIGGASISDAIFIPPINTSLNELMSDLEKFANNDSIILPDLLKIAIIHYQFETIHPFLDGNGRVGRLLIVLYLVNKGILKQPILYLSDFFEKHRSLYYDNLMRVRTHNDLEQWIKFFLTGIIETSKKAVQTFDGILQLQKNIELKLKELGTKSKDASKIIDYLYSNPIINVHKVKEITSKTLKTAYSIIYDLERLEIIKEVTGASRGKLYLFESYIRLFN